MPWLGAEQLLERDGDADQYSSGAHSMFTFELDSRDFPCSCVICQPRRLAPEASPATPASTTSDVADVLTILRPNLVHAARRQLSNRGLDEQLAEDVVQDAIFRWLARGPEYRGQQQLNAWLRKAIGWLVLDRLRPRDLLDLHCASLDENSPRGD